MTPEDIIKIPLEIVETLFREGWLLFIIIGLICFGIYIIFWM